MASSSSSERRRESQREHVSKATDTKRFEKEPPRERRGRNGLPFWTQLHDIGFNSDDPVFYAIGDETSARAWSINLATLQRVRIHALRHSISAKVKKMKDSANERGIERSFSADGSIDPLLHAYCDAIRDFDYMHQRGGNDKGKDPFMISTTSQLDRAMLYDLELITGDCEKSRQYQLALLPRSRQSAEERLARLIERTGGAAASIAALFGPVLIMIFVPTLAATLAVAFGAVLLVVAAVATFTELPANEVMTLSFTYAAVLVVFIGTTLSPGA